MLLDKKDLEFIMHFRADMLSSVYIYSNTDEFYKSFLVRLNNAFDEVKRQYKKRFGQRNNDFESMCERIREDLSIDFADEKANTYCVFIAEEFYRIFKLPVRLKDRVVVSDSFYIKPLVAALNQFTRFCLLVFNRQRAKFFHYYLDQLRQEREIEHNYVLSEFNPTGASWRGWGEKRMANKQKETFNRHLEETSRDLFDHFKNEKFDKLIIASTKEELPKIKPHLHSYLLENLVGEFNAEPEMGETDILERLKKTNVEYKKIKEREELNGLFNMYAHDKAVLGPDLVSGALSRGNAAKIFAVDDFNVKGYVCPKGHFVSVFLPSDKKCIYCKEMLIKEEYLEDEIFQRAYEQSCPVNTIFFEKEKLAPYGIAALLRY